VAQLMQQHGPPAALLQPGHAQRGHHCVHAVRPGKGKSAGNTTTGIVQASRLLSGGEMLPLRYGLSAKTGMWQHSTG
jgi:hypothetical protein